MCVHFAHPIYCPADVVYRERGWREREVDSPEKYII